MSILATEVLAATVAAEGTGPPGSGGNLANSVSFPEKTCGPVSSSRVRRIGAKGANGRPCSPRSRQWPISTAAPSRAASLANSSTRRLVPIMRIAVATEASALRPPSMPRRPAGPASNCAHQRTQRAPVVSMDVVYESPTMGVMRGKETATA